MAATVSASSSSAIRTRSPSIRAGVASINTISRHSRCSGASGRRRTDRSPPLSPRLDHDSLDLALDRSGPIARSDRLGDDVGRSLKLAGIACLDLAAQRCALAERDRDVLGRWRVAYFSPRFDRYVTEACAFEVGSDDGLVVIAVRRPGQETGRVVGKQLFERDRCFMRQHIVLEAIPDVEHERAMAVEDALHFPVGLDAVRKE